MIKESYISYVIYLKGKKTRLINFHTKVQKSIEIKYEMEKKINFIS